MRRAAQSLVAVAAVALLAACGNDRPPSPPGSHDNPLVAKTQDQTAREPGAAGTAAATPAPDYQKLLQRQQARPTRRFTPCNLVTRLQAEGIVGAPIRPLLEAPQGPTCIYRAAKGKGLVTVAVQDVEFRKLAGRVQQATKVKLAGRTGTCGQSGQPTLYLPLSGGRVLTVGSAPCDVAKRFASQAVKHLDA